MSDTEAHPLVAKAKKFYEMLLTDFEGVLRDLVADNFVLENHLPEEIPFGGRYEGREGLARYFTELSEGIELGPMKFDEWLGSGNSVVLRGSESSTACATGKRYTMSFVHWLEFDDDGRVVSMHEYNDTAAMRPAFIPDPE